MPFLAKYRSLFHISIAVASSVVEILNVL